MHAAGLRAERVEVDQTALAVGYARCRHLARRHYENFTVGSWLLPRRLRDDFAAVYAFARGADDLADEGTATPESRLAALRAWEAQLDACAQDPASATDPVFLAIGNTIARHDLTVEPFHDLLRAMRRDAAGEMGSVATFADLLEYCRCSANPVGRLVLGLFGHRDAVRQARSDDICTALQLTNFWQDVGGDLARGRVYLPAEDLDRFPGSHEALTTGTVTAGFRELLAFEVARTRDFFRRGEALADMVTGRLQNEVRMFVGGGSAILDRIEAVGYDVFARRPKLSRGDLARIVLRSLWS